ncbi:MAG TPA: GNAT family N-acetyltransferase [Streptosporangiaceae bacterium]|nr:GNAT family N-acetyltransferase [Streptosporangiaceae bacterium]
MEVRPFGPDDDLEAELDLSRRAFGPISPAGRETRVAGVRRSIDAGAMLGAFEGGRLVGSTRYHIMRQWWHGRSLPMAGVASVKVAPEQRGRGIATAMMAAQLDDIADRGYPLSVLFPATAPLYRAHGWEIAGRRFETVLPTAALTTLARPDLPAPAASAEPEVRRATLADGAAIVDIKGLVHERLLHSGPNTREPWELHRWLDDDDHFAYIADDGFLSYRWSGDMEEIQVEELTAASAATARAFWRILALNANIAGSIRACLAPDDPVTWQIREPVAELHQVDTWMLRIVDAPAAIAGRGFPAGATVAVVLDLADPIRSVNSGRWSLSVSCGAGSLTRLGDAPAAAELTALSVGARGFAALYGGASIRALRLAGLAAGGDPAADSALSAAFCGPAFTIDHF